MSSNTNRPTYRLSSEDAVTVWLRYWAGEFQHRIAASLDVNPGRISDVLKGRLHPESRAAALSRRAAA